MQPVLLVIHLMIAAALVGVVLLQSSEGGALGMGGGGGGGFMTGRGKANLLTRVTAMLAAAFFATSLLLSILSRTSEGPGNFLDSLKTTITTPATNAPPTTTPPAGSTTPPAAPATPPPEPGAPQSQ